MHVLYIHQHFATPNDSIGTRSYEFSRRLISKGHQVTILCGDTANSDNTSKSDERVIRYNVDGINVIKILEPYANAMSFTQRILSFIKFAYRATVVARNTPVDLILATSTPLTVGIPGLFAAKKQKKPFVFEVRDLWPELPVSMGVIKNPIIIWALRYLERKIYQSADAIIALAPGIESGVKSVASNKTPTYMIPNSCDLELFSPKNGSDSTISSESNDGLKVVYCGHHGRANGLDAAISAAKQLKLRCESQIQFYMIGKGSEKKRLETECSELELSDYFQWLDPIPKQKLAEFLTNMDVGFMPLLNIPAFQYGTSPNKFFDYLAAGLPVLNNYPGWVSDLISSHNCGVAVSPNNESELADALVYFRDNKEQRIEMGTNARRLGEEQFSRDLLANKFIEAIEMSHRNYTQNIH